MSNDNPDSIDGILQQQMRSGKKRTNFKKECRSDANNDDWSINIKIERVEFHRKTNVDNVALGCVAVGKKKLSSLNSKSQKTHTRA